MGLVTVNGFYKHDFYKVGSAPFPERWKSVGTQSNRGTKYTVCGGVTRVTNFVISGIYPRKGSFSLIKGRNVQLSLQLRTSPKPVYINIFDKAYSGKTLNDTFVTLLNSRDFHKSLSVFFEGPWRMACTENLPLTRTTLRLILAVCVLFCLQKPAESNPVNSKQVSEGIVSTFIPYLSLYRFNFICSY